MTIHEVDLPRLVLSRRSSVAGERPALALVTDLPDDAAALDLWVQDADGKAVDQFASAVKSTTWFSRLLFDIHSAALRPVVVALDGLVLLLAANASGMRPVGCLIATSALLLSFYLLQIYAERDALQSKGVAWFIGKMMIPLGGITAFGLVFHSIQDRTAALFAFYTFLGLFELRCFTWLVLRGLRLRGHAQLRTLIVGQAETVRTVAAKLNDYPQVGLKPIGSLAVADVLAADGLASAIRVTRAEHVIVAPELGEESAFVDSIRGGGGAHATFSLLPPLADLFLHPGSTNELAGLPLVPLGRLLHRRSSFPGKRALDLVVATFGVMLLSPVIAMTALIIKLDSRGPVFFRQDRTGRDGETFKVMKFRTMVDGAHAQFDELRKSEANISDGLLFKHANDHRITRVGKYLRKSAIDEIPQLFNVLAGEMSLVGPRPLAVAAEEFDPLEHERHSVLPGMTGYWQVSGGNGLTYQEMVRLDLAYIRNWSLWLDIRLMVKTVPALLNRARPS